MNYVRDYGAYLHIDGRLPLARLIQLIQQEGSKKPIVFGDLRGDLSRWRKNHERNITLLRPYQSDMEPYYDGYDLEIISSRYTVWKRRFALHALLDTLNYRLNVSATSGGRLVPGRARFEVQQAIRSNIMGRPYHTTTTYPNRGDTSGLLNEFVKLFGELTGNKIPVPMKN